MKRMQRIVVLALLTIAAVGFIPRQSSGEKETDEEVKAEVLKVDDQLNQAIMMKDRATLRAPVLREALRGLREESGSTRSRPSRTPSPVT